MFYVIYQKKNMCFPFKTTNMCFFENDENKGTKKCSGKKINHKNINTTHKKGFGIDFQFFSTSSISIAKSFSNSQGKYRRSVVLLVCLGKNVSP